MQNTEGMFSIFDDMGYFEQHQEKKMLIHDLLVDVSRIEVKCSLET